jgi:chemotaxis protein MotB
MSRRHKHAAHENHERWLVSYADFITLLFAFFVVMFASSQADKGKAKQISESVTRALEESSVSRAAAAVAKVLGGTVDDKGQGSAQMKGPGGAQKAAKEAPPDEIVELLPSLKLLSKELQQEIASGKVEVTLEARGLIISLKEAILYPSGSNELEDAGIPVIKKVAAAVRAVPNPIRLEGHTDSKPIHTARFHNNWELSSARAVSMLEILEAEFDVPAGRMAVVGYADTVPIGDNGTPEGRAKNRRVDVAILSQIGLQASPKPASAGRHDPSTTKKAH